ncbi:hypothetical protein SDC9_105459 [bioreactor metagenome]|uniref:Uncharacterized protein n=1 Tax=bioreactor metagenome TaxID=1076179 RepID=A0A645AZN2_9ZZZZ
MVEAQLALARNQARREVLERFELWQYAEANLLLQKKRLVANGLPNQLSLLVKPAPRGVRQHAGVVQRVKPVGRQQPCAVSASVADNGIPMTAHGEFCSAAGAAIQQRMELVGNPPAAVVAHVCLLVPFVIVVLNRAIQLSLDFLRAHAGELLGRKQLVDDDVHATRPLVQAVLRASQVATGNFRNVHRYAKVLEQLSAADGAGLVSAANGTHALRKQNHTPAAAQHAGNLLDRINIRREVLFWNDL